jgi:two-component system cell cycle sensor histidine kinase PleC
MSHELRTPLNAVIGFSEVMLRELHGPLGHARYQEYAAHISESGGQLLKASEDTLAVTATMSALMANRTGGRRERVLAATLVREAWVRAAAGAPSRDIQLVVTSCNSCAIECERRATSQALEHLLREAFAKVPAAGAVEVRGRRKSGARSIEICVTGPGASEAHPPAASGLPASPGRSADPLVAGGSLRVMLARLLLEMQGATVSVWDGHDGVSWSACVAFPPQG